MQKVYCCSRCGRIMREYEKETFGKFLVCDVPVEDNQSQFCEVQIYWIDLGGEG